jgi:hypothetical protein
MAIWTSERAFSRSAAGPRLPAPDYPGIDPLQLKARPLCDLASTLSKQNPFSLVRAVGIEPTLLAEPDFESGASTSK